MAFVWGGATGEETGGVMVDLPFAAGTGIGAGASFLSGCGCCCCCCALGFGFSNTSKGDTKSNIDLPCGAAWAGGDTTVAGAEAGGGVGRLEEGAGGVETEGMCACCVGVPLAPDCTGGGDTMWLGREGEGNADPDGPDPPVRCTATGCGRPPPLPSLSHQPRGSALSWTSGVTHGDLSILSIFVLCSPPFEAFSDPGVVEANGVLVPDAVLSLPAPGTCPVELTSVLGAMLIPFNIPSKFAV